MQTIFLQNGLTPMHLCAQEDKHKVAAVLDNYHADINPETKVIIQLRNITDK